MFTSFALHDEFAYFNGNDYMYVGIDEVSLTALSDFIITH